MSEQTINEEEARHLRRIAKDLRSSGNDVHLVLLSEEGVSTEVVTLADELWLIALRLDPGHAFDEVDGA